MPRRVGRGIPMPYTAKAVANFFLDLGKSQNSPITPMKLQKLLYYAQGWCLAIADESLIDEQIEAWKWGPVIRSIYHEFKEFGNSPISRPANATRVTTEGGHLRFACSTPTIESNKTDPDNLGFTKALLNKVWEIYGKYTPTQLSNMTHAKGEPWDVVVSQYKGSPPKGTDIPQALIKTHFVGMMGKHDE